MKQLGVAVAPSQLVSPQYVSAWQGSSLKDLVRAADDFGLHTLALSGLSVQGLSVIQSPAILHVRSLEPGASYDHWVLFSRYSDGKAVIVDPSVGAREISLSELTLRWDGTLLIVSDKQIDRTPIDFASMGSTYWVLIALAAIILHARFGSSARLQRSSMSSLPARCGLVALSVAAFALLAQVCDAQSLVRERNAVELAQRMSRESFLQKISTSTMLKLLTQNPENALLLIDARIENDFDRGHLPGAINIPALSDSQSVREALGDAERSRPIVIYCANRECRFAHALAVRLLDVGFAQVSVYQEGFDGWRAAGGRIQ